MDWRHRAICRDEDPELFFPIGNTGPALLQIEQAKAVCRRCPVVSQCLAWALESGQDAGVGRSCGRHRCLTADPRAVAQQHRDNGRGPRAVGAIADRHGSVELGGHQGADDLHAQLFGGRHVEALGQSHPVVID
jgi:WhiB family redox-sensing transcriptional regulator